MTASQYESWASNPNAYIADEEDEIFTARVSGELLLEELVSVSPYFFCTGTTDVLSSLFHWQKVCEDAYASLLVPTMLLCLPTHLCVYVGARLRICTACVRVPMLLCLPMHLRVHVGALLRICTGMSEGAYACPIVCALASLRLRLHSS
jgi:hypothetical protein